jgi:hypothetical protein
MQLRCLFQQQLIWIQEKGKAGTAKKEPCANAEHLRPGNIFLNALPSACATMANLL